MPEPSTNAKSQVISIRLQQQQHKRLQSFARRMKLTPSETAALLIEEGLREEEFGFIEFRNSPRGRQAYIQGSRLTVWQIVMIGRGFQMNVKQIAEHLFCADFHVQAALNYYAAFPAEIDEALEEHDSFDFEKLSRMLPSAVDYVVKDNPALVAEKSEDTYTTNITAKTRKPSSPRKRTGKQ